jgi:hypothetical protein
MRSLTLILLITLPALACTAAPASDDEANVTTAISESSTSSPDTGTTTDTSGPPTSASSADDPSGSDTIDGSSESDESGTFIPRTDWNEGFCDSFDQICPEGEKCVPYSNDGGLYPNANKCVPVLGSAEPGSPCTWSGIVEATDDCNAASRCLVEDGSMMGTCVAFCTGSPASPICAPELTCVMGFEGTVADCLPQCHPAFPHVSCSEGQGCYWTGSAFECVDVAGELGPGDACEFVNVCAPGQLCAEAALVPGCESTGCCTPFCTLEFGCVVEGSECVPFFEPGSAPLGLADLGLCMLP